MYELLDDGSTMITRKNDQNEVQGTPIIIDPLYDMEQQPVLPVLHVKFGTHPDVEWLGSGLLMGLDDIVIDLFNVLSEVREAYRDAAFALLVYTGDSYEELVEKMKAGTRMVGLGAMENAKLDRLAADAGEVAAGLTLVDAGIKAWALAAKRKAADAMDGASGDARSGISLQAEFQLDLKPLLVAIAEALDNLETNALFLLAQMYGKTPEQAKVVTCTRNTEFRLEEEASRISRITKEFIQTLPLPGEAKRQITLKWIEASGLVDMEEPVESASDATAAAGQKKTTAGDLIKQQVAATSDQQQQTDERPPEPTGLGFN
jgi:hypothetical protein